MTQFNDQLPKDIRETEINLIQARTRISGDLLLGGFTRFNGVVIGKVQIEGPSEFVLEENGVVEGEIEGHVVIVDGFVRGDIRAREKIVISESGRVIGNLTAPNVSIQFGATFNGKCVTSIFEESIAT